MAGAVRLGDVCTGHGCYSSRSNTQGSNNVYINGLPAHRVGDRWSTHCCGISCHSSSASSGSPTVIVNGKSLCRIGDSVACGSKMASGSTDVIVG